MYCSKCGKKLADGEICGCATAAETATPDVIDIENAQSIAEETAPSAAETASVEKAEETVEPAAEETVHATEEPAQTTVIATAAPSSAPVDTSKALPDGKAVADAVASNPFVTETLACIKRFFVNAPSVEVANAAKRNDILWVIFLVFETLISGFLIPAIIIRSIYTLVSDGSESMSSSMFNEALEYIGISYGSFIIPSLFIPIVSFVTMTVIFIIIFAIYRKKIVFGNIANDVSISLFPISLFTVLGVIFSFFAPAFNLLIIVFGITCTAVLAYVALQRLVKFEKSPFWAYLIGISLYEFIVLRFSMLELSPLVNKVQDSLNSLESLISYLG